MDSGIPFCLIEEVNPPNGVGTLVIVSAEYFEAVHTLLLLPALDVLLELDFLLFREISLHFISSSLWTRPAELELMGEACTATADQRREELLLLLLLADTGTVDFKALAVDTSILFVVRDLVDDICDSSSDAVGVARTGAVANFVASRDTLAVSASSFSLRNFSLSEISFSLSSLARSFSTSFSLSASLWRAAPLSSSAVNSSCLCFSSS